PKAMLGMSIWEYLMRTPDLQQLFNEAMTANARVMHAAAIRAYDFSGIRRLVDVGGGQGALLCQILAAHTEIDGILLERPETVPAAQAYIRQAGLAERCEVVGGDFFRDVPGGDAHIMSHVLHDWEDDQVLAILSACYRSGTPGTRLLVVEMVIPAGNEPSFAKLVDMEMLVMVGGRERTAAEYEALFASAGYRLARILPGQGPASVLEAVRL
ncbi:MAG: methyltransferase, partial [Terriglobales bacterium]